MIERVAKAMAAKEGWRWEDDRQMLDCAAAGLQNTSRERDTWRNRSRAAIEAMREPTEAVLNAPYEAEIDFGPGGTGDVQACPSNVWAAMIDAPLSKAPSKGTEQ